jgi:hypothetical protein
MAYVFISFPHLYSMGILFPDNGWSGSTWYPFTHSIKSSCELSMKAGWKTSADHPAARVDPFPERREARSNWGKINAGLSFLYARIRQLCKLRVNGRTNDHLTNLSARSPSFHRQADGEGGPFA